MAGGTSRAKDVSVSGDELWDLLAVAWKQEETDRIAAEAAANATSSVLNSTRPRCVYLWFIHGPVRSSAVSSLTSHVS